MVTALGKLKTIIDSISATVLPLKFKYLEGKPSSFPAGMVISNGFSEEAIDNMTNLLTESFTVRIIFPQAEGASGYEKWLTLADSISAELRKKENQTLTGAAINMMVKQALPPTFTDTEYIQPVVIFDIIVEAQITKTI